MSAPATQTASPPQTRIAPAQPVIESRRLSMRFGSRLVLDDVKLTARELLQPGVERHE